jgi:aprataxin
MSFPPLTTPPPPDPGNPGAGLQALMVAIKHISSGSPHPLKFYMDDTFIVIYDQFPKSRIHLLILPKDVRITDLGALGPSHIPFIRSMLDIADRIVRHIQAAEPRTRLIYGFHAIPSLRPLHMHLMSLDLNTPYMKKKKHYNSFSTNFFLPGRNILRELETSGRVTSILDRRSLEALEEGPMKCLWCEKPLSNMPEVKSHIPSCPRNGSVIK